MTRKKRQRPMPTGQDSPTVIYSDALLRILLVVEHRGELWLCPRRPGGWSSRQRLQMTEAARSERLRLARDVTPVWLGIDGGKRCETAADSDAKGATGPTVKKL